MRPILFGSLIVAVAGASCANTEPTQDEYDDVAQAVGSITAPAGGGGEVGSFADSADIAVGETPTGLTLGGNGHFMGEHLGLDYDYQITCKSTAGQVLATCGPTTDSANLTLSWSGDLELPNVSASVSRTGDWTLSDLQQGGATFGGEGTFVFDISVTSIFRPVTASYHLDYAATYSAVKIDTNRRAVGGSIHYAISAEHKVTRNASTSDRSFELDAVVTFLADGSATLTLDGSHRYHLDLGTGTVSKM